MIAKEVEAPLYPADEGILRVLFKRHREPGTVRNKFSKQPSIQAQRKSIFIANLLILRNINVWNGNGKYFDASFFKVEESCMQFALFEPGRRHR